MLIPLISVSLIGLVAGLGGLARKAPPAVLVRCLVAAWVGFALGAIVGLVLDVFLLGGFWLGLVGHATAILGASRTAHVSMPSPRRQVSA